MVNLSSCLQKSLQLSMIQVFERDSVAWSTIVFTIYSLPNTDIDQLYQEQDKEEYAEGLIDIYVALAAKALANYSVAKQAPNVLPQVVMEHNKKLIECLKLVDEKQRLNEYTWLIRGFFEILQGANPCSFACV